MYADQTRPEPRTGSYPIDLIAEYPERSSRGLALAAILFFLKAFLLLPHMFALFFVSFASGLITLIGQIIVLFTGSYPESLWQFQLGAQRWNLRVNAWLYGLTDAYPPFSLQAGGYPVDLVGLRPERSSRLLALAFLFFGLKWILLIPHYVVLWFLGIAQVFCLVIGYWAVLILGRYPRALWNFMVGGLRWSARVSVWMGGLVDQYPPFRLE
jgi:hypothetical protein